MPAHPLRARLPRTHGGKPVWARISGAEQTGVAATTLLKHYGKFSRTLDADRAELSKIKGEGGTDCPRSAHHDEGENSTAEVSDAARCLRLDHPLCAPSKRA